MTTKPLDGKTAIITGAARRIGRATAVALAEAGANVVVNTRSARAEAEITAAAVVAAGGQALVHVGDITDESVAKAMAEAALARFGRIDVLVNNAAIRSDISFLDMTLADWRSVTGVVLDGAFLCSRAVIPAMLRQGYGRIVNIGGVSAHIGAKERAHVITAKIGITGFTRALAVEFADKGITVNCVVPGRIGGERSATSGKGISGMPLVGHEGEAKDVARTIRFLCEPGANYLTGQTLHVNGGMFMP